MSPGSMVTSPWGVRLSTSLQSSQAWAGWVPAAPPAPGSPHGSLWPLGRERGHGVLSDWGWAMQGAE